MKTKIENKSFDTVKTFREIKEKISKELYGKSAKEIIAYLKKNSEKFNAK